MEVRTRTLILGRALVIEILWYERSTLSCMNVYVLNRSRENQNFWTEMKNSWTTRLQMLEPSIILEDMNIVEETIDRLPPHMDNAEAVTTLWSLKSHLKLADRW